MKKNGSLLSPASSHAADTYEYADEANDFDPAGVFPQLHRNSMRHTFGSLAGNCCPRYVLLHCCALHRHAPLLTLVCRFVGPFSAHEPWDCPHPVADRADAGRVPHPLHPPGAGVPTDARGHGRKKKAAAARAHQGKVPRRGVRPFFLPPSPCPSAGRDDGEKEGRSAAPWADGVDAACRVSTGPVAPRRIATAKSPPRY